MCIIREGEDVDFKLVPQHMFLKVKNQSDHVALETIVQAAVGALHTKRCVGLFPAPTHCLLTGAELE